MLEMTVAEMKMTKSFVECVVDGKIYNLSKSYLLLAINEVKRWQYGGATNFTAKLIGLIAKADSSNKRKIFKGFPEEVIAYLMWYTKIAFGKKYEGDQEFFEAMRELLDTEREVENE